MEQSRRSRAAAVAGALGATVMVAWSRWVAEPFWGTSWWVLLAALVAAGALLRCAVMLGSAWIRWRQALAVVAGLLAAYPTFWAVAALADDLGSGSRTTWFFAVVAGSAHLPLIAAFSVLPLLATSYLGAGLARLPGVIVLALLVVSWATFVLFFDDFEPFAARALVDSPAGKQVGMVANLLFLATVLLGPVIPLHAAWRSDGPAARRLALVGASSLSGAALVMLCGIVGEASGRGAVAVLVGLCLAVGVLGVGCSRALDVESASVAGFEVVEGSSDSRRSSFRPGVLTTRESEVLALLADGMSNAGIAARLVISERTVDAHLRSVFTKLDLPAGPEDNRRVHAARFWIARAEGSEPG